MLDSSWKRLGIDRHVTISQVRNQIPRPTVDPLRRIHTRGNSLALAHAGHGAGLLVDIWVVVGSHGQGRRRARCLLSPARRAQGTPPRRAAIGTPPDEHSPMFP